MAINFEEELDKALSPDLNKAGVRRSAAKSKKVHWSKLVNAESADGTWDWFNPTGESRMRLVKFVDDKPVAEVDFSEEEWIDLVKLIKRIS